MTKFLFTPLQFAMATLVCLCVFSACSSEEDPIDTTADDLNIFEELLADDDFVLLQKAFTKSGLHTQINREDLDLTLFAPTDAAFQEFLGSRTIDSLSGPELQRLLNYHMLNSNSLVADFEGYNSNRGYLTTRNLEGPDETSLSLFFDRESGMKLNGTSIVIEADKEAKNGVIHVVDQVLVPASMGDAIGYNSDLAHLKSATDLASFTNDLNLAGAASFFSPVNSAFTAWYNDLGVSGPTDLTAIELEEVLQYHYVADTNLVAAIVPTDTTARIQTGLFDRTILLTRNEADNVLQITDFNSNNWQTEDTDVQCTNGVLHLVNGVFRP